MILLLATLNPEETLKKIEEICDAQNIWVLLGILTIAVVAGMVNARRALKAQKLIEVYAYCGGVWAGIQLGLLVYQNSEPSSAEGARVYLDVAVSSGGAAAIFLASLMGIVSVLGPLFAESSRKPEPLETPSPTPVKTDEEHRSGVEVPGSQGHPDCWP